MVIQDELIVNERSQQFWMKDFKSDENNSMPKFKPTGQWNLYNIKKWCWFTAQFVFKPEKKYFLELSMIKSQVIFSNNVLQKTFLQSR